MMNEGELVMNVNFISANDGKIELYDSVDNLIIASGDYLELAVAINGLNLDLTNAYASSSMDFADEYGFATHSGAYDLLTMALEAA
jgi:hypothetical protein